MEDNVPERASLTENQKNLEKNDNAPEPDVNNPADEGVITVIISYESTELKEKKTSSYLHLSMEGKSLIILKLAEGLTDKNIAPSELLSLSPNPISKFKKDPLALEREI